MSLPNSLKENANSKKHKLPGFRCSVKSQSRPMGHYFPHPLWQGFKSIRLTYREIRMMDFINRITDQCGWEEKVFDNSIVDDWQKKTDSIQSGVLNGDVFLSKNMFDYCIEELRVKAKQAKVTGIVDVMDADMAVAKSDIIIPSSLAEALKASVKSLEDVPEVKKNWQPKSDQTVLNLVDPSLFPVVYGTTRVLPYGHIPLHNCTSSAGEGETTMPFTRRLGTTPPSRWASHQWLPTDINWSEAGLKIASYINDLHPEDHDDMYKLLEEFVAAAVTLWEECISFVPLRHPRIGVDERSKPNVKFYLPEGVHFAIPDSYVEYTMTDGRRCYRKGYENCREYQEWFHQHKIGWPEPRIGIGCERIIPEAHGTPRATKVNLRTSFPLGIQVVFKFTNIHLSPEKPHFKGESWSVEGALNDRIVATAIYDYDVENVTDSRVDFRQYIRDETPENGLHYSEQESRWFLETDSPFQEIGHVNIRPGRMLAYPNVFQHQVRPFQLRDPTKPGHRKILTMFLIDPNIRIISTGVVPPQRRDWWARQIALISPFSKLPTEVFDMIMNFVEGFPMSLEEAKAVRETVLEERVNINREWERKKIDEWDNPFEDY
ncbi:uncharacterized protein F4807DRAFT_300951 [Annulohypoxylon truncatum]|uniref:uncharacterized protein n=1 Tax=Annulohypoxylon truncatum TaxID=327061 RepID=UPI002007D362|nr:uncharacterized protein F4807DRAFT_300951 [Annulohypoxylon truncatum]KAI1204944.1 hypothetical protein F4807DRAFT_300951 [Annulohypoxylon truncatum]